MTHVTSSGSTITEDDTRRLQELLDGGPPLDPALWDRRTAASLHARGEFTHVDVEVLRRAVAQELGERWRRAGGLTLLDANGSPGVDEMPSSWVPVDLRTAGTHPPEPAAFLKRSDGRALLYRGKTHWLMGETESAKTWLALAACREVLEGEGRVLFIDFEDEAPTFLERLGALDVATDTLYDDTRVRFVRPTEPSSALHTPALLEYEPDLVIFDGVTAAFDVEGIDPDKGSQVAGWMRRVLLPFARNGAAVAALDHVTKSKETRGRYAIGSVHKLNGVTGAAYVIEAIRPLARAHLDPVEALVRITIAKDRPGHVRSAAAPSGVIADASITAYPDGGITCRLHKPGHATGTEHRTRIAEHLVIYPGASKNDLRTLGNSDTVDETVKAMVLDGLVEVRKEGAAHRHYLTDAGTQTYDTTHEEHR